MAASEAAARLARSMTEGELQEGRIWIWIAGPVGTKARPRFAAGSAYTPRKTREKEARIAWEFRSVCNRPILDSDVGVVLHFELATGQRCDLDNMVKLVLDAANGILWRDDFQVAELRATVQRGVTSPGMHVMVYRTGEPYAKTCPQCLRSFVQSNGRRAPGKYCSKACFDVAQTTGAQYRACFTCGQNVFRRAGKLAYARSFCSSECKAKANNIEATCRGCGSIFRVYKNHRTKSPFCSVECSVAWHATRTPTSKMRGTCSACGRPRASNAPGLCRRCFIARRAGIESTGRIEEELRGLP